MTVRRSFNKAAKTYDSAAFLQRTVSEELVSRLSELESDKTIILDMGAGTGFATRFLIEKYPDSWVIALDFSWNMLIEARVNTVICTDAHMLPLQNHSVDLIFSNLCFQWCQNLQTVFQECLRVLKKGGILLFSTLGPDTLQELRTSWRTVDAQHTHVNSFCDMHDVGDLLLQVGFVDPVVDRDHYGLVFPTVYDLLKDLKTLGSIKLDKTIRRGLTTKRDLAKMADCYEQYRNSEQLLPVTYEVIFGIAKKRFSLLTT